MRSTIISRISLMLGIVCVIALMALIRTTVSADSDWPSDRHYRVAVEVDTPAEPASGGDVMTKGGDTTEGQVPVSAEIDFGSRLTQAGQTEPFDPRSISVMAVDPKTGQQRPVEYLADEFFDKGPVGKVSWLVSVGTRGPQKYFVYFNAVGAGPYDQGYIPLVGIGDNFRYNRNDGKEPLNPGLTIRPHSADFDGDGKIDLLSPIIYYNTYQQPPFAIYFWRNIGSNEKPVYDDFVRLYDSDGSQLKCKYPGQGYGPVAVVDWDGDKLPDLITENALYRNTGKLNPAGGIVFAKDSQIAPEKQKGDLRIFGYADHDDNGVSDLFYTLLAVHYNYEGPPPVNYFYTVLYRRANTAPAGAKPVFTDQFEPISLGGKLEQENRYITTFGDIDDDGDLDVLGCYLPLDRIPAYPSNCYWLNIAPKGQPPVYGPARTLPNMINTIVALNAETIVCPLASPAADRFGLLPVNNAAYQGLFAENQNCISYLKAVGKNPPGSIPAWSFEDHGLLCQRHARCAVGAFSGVDVVDWENDGDWDLIAGDEAGYNWLIKNIGTNARPVFENPVQILADYQPMRIERWYYMQDSNPEYFLGQTKPQCIDWDGDGDLDIVIANNTDRQVYFENIGSREKPQFAAGVPLRVGLEEGPWALRCRPAIADFDGDGLPDLVTLSKHAYLCLFRCDKTAGPRQLLPGQPLTYTDGSPVRNWDMTTPGAPLALASAKANYYAGPRSLTQFEAVDWDGDGDFDIISTLGESTEKEPALWENVGTKTNPVFKEPVRLQCRGQKIMLARHEQTYAAVDWFGTGKPDLVCGAESGWFYFFRRCVLDESAVPAINVADILEINHGSHTKQ